MDGTPPVFDIEAPTEAGDQSGTGAAQAPTTLPDTAVTLIAQMTLSVASKTLGPVSPHMLQLPLFKFYTVVNLATFTIDLVLISYFTLTLFGAAETPTGQRMAVVKVLIWAALLLSLISFLLASSILLAI